MALIKRKKCGRARLRPGRDIAIGIAFANAVQTELDPPTAANAVQTELDPFANAVQTELDPPPLMDQTFFESV